MGQVVKFHLARVLSLPSERPMLETGAGYATGSNLCPPRHGPITADRTTDKYVPTSKPAAQSVLIYKSQTIKSVKCGFQK